MSEPGGRPDEIRRKVDMGQLLASVLAAVERETVAAIAPAAEAAVYGLRSTQVNRLWRPVVRCDTHSGSSISKQPIATRRISLGRFFLLFLPPKPDVASLGMRDAD